MQLVINSRLLREIDERKLVLAYARFVYLEEQDVTEDERIKNNLNQILDWDLNGEEGLGIYCSKFESIKNKDWEILINIIKKNASEIAKLAEEPLRFKILEDVKVIREKLERKKARTVERCEDPNYEVSGRGKKAKPCYYKGRYYKSRQECEIKEHLHRYELYKYLEETNQL